MHKICSGYYPNIDFFVSFGIWVGQNGFWGWAGGVGGVLYPPTYAVYIPT